MTAPCILHPAVLSSSAIRVSITSGPPSPELGLANPKLTGFLNLWAFSPLAKGLTVPEPKESLRIVWMSEFSFDCRIEAEVEVF